MLALNAKHSFATLALAVALGVTGCAPTPIDSVRLDIEEMLGVPAKDTPSRLVRAADRAMLANNPEAAAALLRQALIMKPNDRDLRYRLAEASLAYSDFASAGDLYQNLLAEQPNSKMAAHGLAKVYLRSEQPERAEVHLLTFIERGHGDVDTLNLLGVSLDEQDRPLEAQGVYRKGLNANPGHVKLRNNLAMSLLETGDVQEAVALLEPIGLAPDAGPLVRANLMLAYVKAGRIVDARRVGLRDMDADRVKDELVRLAGLGTASTGDSSGLDQHRPRMTSSPRPLIGLAGPSGAVIGGVAAMGRYVADLGRFADAEQADRRWRVIAKDARGKSLSGGTERELKRLGGSGEALLVGTFATEKAARAFCEQAPAPTCKVAEI